MACEIDRLKHRVTCEDAPGSITGLVKFAWREILEVLDRGHSLHELRKMMLSGGRSVSYDHLSRAISRERRRRESKKAAN